MNFSNNNRCYICLQNNDVITINPCLCLNTGVHEKCLLKWLSISKKNHCLVCNYEYQYEKVFIKNCKLFRMNLKKNFCNFNYNYNVDNIIKIIILGMSIIELCFIPLISYVLYQINVFIIISFFAAKIFFFCINKIFFKNEFPFYLLLYWEFLVSFIFYICIIIDFLLNINDCRAICSFDGKKCNNNCEYYESYLENNSKYVNLLLIKSLILITLTLINFTLQIKKSLFFDRILEYSK